MAPSSSSPNVTILSKLVAYPDSNSTIGDLKLSVSDLPMLSCHYIQKGLFFSPPPVPITHLVSNLLSSLSAALSIFPALAGRFITRPDGVIVISCVDVGVDFFHAAAPGLTLASLLPPDSDVPVPVRRLFPMECTVSYEGHFRPLAAFQLTALGDGAVFIGAAVNHAVVDGTSFWNFFNTWAALCRGDDGALSPPDFRRNYFGKSTAVLRFPGGAGPVVTFLADAPVRERFFHFSGAAIRELKVKANRRITKLAANDRESEVYGKSIYDHKEAAKDGEISSFQALCAQIWRSTTRARKQLPLDATTTFRMAVNCRHRVNPPVSANYFGNAIQSVATRAAVLEVARSGIEHTAALLHRSVAAHGDGAVRRAVAEWEAAPRCFPLGNPDGAGVTMGSSNRFPMYDGNDFGWGRPVTVRSGKANKFDGKMSAFPGRDGGGSVEVEVCLAPETMEALIQDEEFMHYVSKE
ncbi:BAHD acyltransferase DCR-like [Typha angustifolia]|uniref:BAHD acyltransferase DCR-like n=1 Tax=Typha angustifolia TaxID=59011 RepID=UPI003C2F8FAC